MATLSRTTSGLLAINAWNGDSLPGSAIPFVAADWTASTDRYQPLVLVGGGGSIILRMGGA